MAKTDSTKRVCIVLLSLAFTAISAPAQVFTVTADFGGRLGDNPQGSLVPGIDGNLCGTTTQIFGTVYRITQTGAEAIYGFCSIPFCLDGYLPQAGLTLGTDGNFYGTTLSGGSAANCFKTYGCGTVFKITPNGQLTTVYSFCTLAACTDGTQPWAGLVLGIDGSFYGTTLLAGADGYGTIFKITPGGSLTTLHSFNLADGYSPQSALIQAMDGNFYGTTQLGGALNGGTVFKMTGSGKLTTLYNFCGLPGCVGISGLPVGQNPNAGLFQGSDGTLYGATLRGPGSVFKPGGALFKITPSGDLTIFYSFCSQANCNDGNAPEGALIQGNDGNFYGTTGGGGSIGWGTIFKITPSGTLTTLYSFDLTDGAGPYGLMQGTNGTFAGITYQGGNGRACNTDGCGVAYSFDTGLGPFVTFVRAAGKVGQTMGIPRPKFNWNDQRLTKRNSGTIHREVRYVNSCQRSCRCHHGLCHCDHSKRHADEQCAVPRYPLGSLIWTRMAELSICQLA